MVGQHDEGRQVVVEGTEAVADPRAGARETGELKPRRLQQRGRAVHPGLAGHIVDESQLVHDLAEGRDDLAEEFAAAAVRPEIPEGTEPRPETILERLDRLAKVAGLAVSLHQLGLVVEEVEVAGRPRHKELHDALRPRRRRARRGCCEGPVAAEHRRERETAETAPGTPEEFAARRGGRGGQPVIGGVVGHRRG